MKDPLAQLLLSALAFAPKPDLIGQLAISSASGQLVDRFTDELNSEQLTDDHMHQQDMQEVFCAEWPELCVMLPLPTGAGTTPVIHWEPSFGPGARGDVN